MNKQRFFVTATGTGIGKSFITAGLVRQAKALGRSVMAYKPVISGFVPAQAADSDTGLLCRSLHLPVSAETIQSISPWRYAAPLAPSIAARREGRPLNFNQLVGQSQDWLAGPQELVLIEGVGGLMVPLTDHHTVCDWLGVLGIPCLLVTGSYLGTLSHTLSALDILLQRRIPVQAIIVNQSPDTSIETLDETAAELGFWTKVPIISLLRREGADAWQELPELGELLAST